MPKTFAQRSILLYTYIIKHRHFFFFFLDTDFLTEQTISVKPELPARVHVFMGLLHVLYLKEKDRAAKREPCTQTEPATQSHAHPYTCHSQSAMRQCLTTARLQDLFFSLA